MSRAFRNVLILSLAWAGAALFAAGVRAQSPDTGARSTVVSGESGGSRAPAAAGALERLYELGSRQLEREDPVEARQTFLLLIDLAGESAADLVRGRVGLGRAHLALGRPWIALRHARRAVALDPNADAALGLEVRCLLRARKFREGAARSAALLERVGAEQAGAELWAAHGSALFRLQKVEEAAAAYREVLKRDPLHPEAHLRLGSGLTEPRIARVGAGLRDAIRAHRAGELDSAIDRYAAVLERDPEHPIAHRLLGEALWTRRARGALAVAEPSFEQLRAALPAPELPDRDLLHRFLPQFEELGPKRRDAAARALQLFASRLPRIVGRGGRHDLLLEDERTTDAESRARLRGQKTFDGRVWDDVRGIGGLRAATGIEALDEAAGFGFDTLAHELAHQAHLYGFSKRSIDVRIRGLFEVARREHRFLDYYAASNHAEYFAQGVEAFHCLAKRPTAEPTHGHTRFELLRVDPELYALVEELVDVDPLAAGAPAATRTRLLEISIETALRSGRADDAVVAAELMQAGSARDEQLQRARAAALRSRSM